MFVDAANRITGFVLDAGCGTGENTLFLAGRRCRIAGIDFVEEAINRAKRKAVERGLTATFLVKDARTLKDWSKRFDNMVDSGLFHVFSDEDRRHYVDGLAAALNPGGRLFLGCLSDEEAGTQGPRRVSKKELHATFTGAGASSPSSLTICPVRVRCPGLSASQACASENGACHKTKRHIGQVDIRKPHSRANCLHMNKKRSGYAAREFPLHLNQQKRSRES